jgi:hypothetical protein
LVAIAAEYMVGVRNRNGERNGMQNRGSGSCLPSLIAVAGRRKVQPATTVVTVGGSNSGVAFHGEERQGGGQGSTGRGSSTVRERQTTSREADHQQQRPVSVEDLRRSIPCVLL